MSKLTFKQFLEEAKKKDNSKNPQDKTKKELPPSKSAVKPIPLKTQVKPIETADEKREPTPGELALKAALRQSKLQGHTRSLADILGIYPA